MLAHGAFQFSTGTYRKEILKALPGIKNVRLKFHLLSTNDKVRENIALPWPRFLPQRCKMCVCVMQAVFVSYYYYTLVIVHRRYFERKLYFLLLLFYSRSCTQKMYAFSSINCSLIKRPRLCEYRLKKFLESRY